MRLLCLSNGHGEDVIAVRILEQLRREAPDWKLCALPIVGEGQAYRRSGIAIAGPVQSMPSGGFVYMDGRQLWRDVRGGLFGLTGAQLRVVRRWGKTEGTILAVGDIVPLAMAWWSGAVFGFVGTAKSEYYLRDDRGWLTSTSWLERRLGAVYLPWERGLLGHKRCRGVFARDRLTAQVLQGHGVPSFDFGNPMMDAIAPEVPLDNVSEERLTVLLLPGSRMPEAAANWQLLLTAIASLIAHLPERSLLFLGAIAPTVEREWLAAASVQQGWTPAELADLPFSEPAAIALVRERAGLVLTQRAYHSCLLAADLAIAMAGTATEQFVGLGKPAVTFPGTGPQFTYRFAEAQSRHLGSSVLLLTRPEETGVAVARLLEDRDRLAAIAANGQQRMGEPGAARRIARCLRDRLEPPNADPV